MTITLDELFSAGGAAGTAALDTYRTELNKAYAESASGNVRLESPESKILVKGGGRQRAAVEKLESLEKAWGAGGYTAADGATDFGAELAAMRAELIGDIQKDWTPSNPVGGTGLTPYDLEGPAKVLVPRYTPLRNSTPRAKGQGNARKFKRILSYSNAGIPGGAANLSPFFDSSTQTATFGGPGNSTFNRPQKITYTGDDHTYSYVELGFSDQVNFKAQFQGLGFDDLRSQSHTALLYSHMMGEERAMLYARGATGGGYSGIVAAPTSVLLATAGTGGTIAAATYYVYVAAVTGFGQSAVSIVASQVVAGPTSTLSITGFTEPTGALYYNVYVGTTTGIANAWLQGSFTGTAYTMTSITLSGTQTAGTDSSFSSTAYDGWLTVQSDPTKTGYLKRLNTNFSTANPGSEIDLALVTMFVNNGADPDQIMMTGAVRSAYNALMRNAPSSGSANGYRTNVTTGDGNAIMGTVVGGHLNPNTGKVVDVITHRFMPQGSVLIRSMSLPLPDAHIPAPSQVVNVQDYMGIDWPVIQMSYDISTYNIGTLIHYAPAWNGLILGVAATSTAGV
jgi:hypothetical protein